MKESITQESDYGCGVACYAFALDISYVDAAKQLGDEQANSSRFYVKDLREALINAGKEYVSKQVKQNQRQEYLEGTIVLIRRSQRYPTGHYLIRHKKHWMDPWINLAYSKDVKLAKSGFRRRLPGKSMYVLIPTFS